MPKSSACIWKTESYKFLRVSLSNNAHIGFHTLKN